MAVMLTTVDNPFSPFDQWDEWFVWDAQAGYHTCSFLSRLVHTSNELSDEDQLMLIETTIDEIVQENPTGTYIKVTRD